MSTTSSTPVIESKTARKRKAKASSATPPPADTSAEVKVNGEADDGESHYLKELAKHIRNVQKKLTGVSKTEGTIAEFSGLSLDELVSQKKINADQKTQLLKKPQLEAQKAQLEEQLKTFTEFAQDLEGRFSKEKAALVEAHQAELEKAKDEATQGSTDASSAKVQEALQVTCQFLHAAAYQRQQTDVAEEESKAYEAVLFHLYQGNSVAVETITNVVQGKDEKIFDPTTGEEINFTFAQLKTSSVNTVRDEDAETQEAVEPIPAAEEPSTDPTLANAGLTELEDTATIPISATEDTSLDDVPSAAPEQASTADEAANAVAESSWNAEASMTTDNTQTGEDWVQVPRDPAETETGSAAPAAQQSTSNWADEAGAAAEEKVATPVSENDGFSEVRRDRGGRGRGGRGRGLDGRGRGRGRGESRGRGGGRGRGGPRGAPQSQAS